MVRRTASLVVISSAIVAACGGCDLSSATETYSAAPIAPPATGAATTPIPREQPKPQPGARTKVLAAAGDRSYDKTFDDIRFEMQLDEPFRREMLTDEIEAMFGQPMRIRGFMLPTDRKNGIREFVLVRDNQECCFGPGAALYDCILIRMPPGQSAEYSIRPVAVEGTFRFNEVVMPTTGRHLAIYQIDAESAR